MIDPQADDAVTPVRLQVRRFVRALADRTLDDSGEVDYPTLADKAKEEFLTNADFVKQIGKLIYGLAYGEAIRWGTERRSSKGHTDDNIIPGTTGVIKPDVLAGKVRRSRWAEWVEHTGSRVVALKEMARTDLLSAAEQREGRASTEIERSQFLRRLASELEGEQTVGARFSDAEIDAIYRSVPTARRNKPKVAVA